MILPHASPRSLQGPFSSWLRGEYASRWGKSPFKGRCHHDPPRSMPTSALGFDRGAKASEGWFVPERQENCWDACGRLREPPGVEYLRFEVTGPLSANLQPLLDSLNAGGEWYFCLIVCLFWETSEQLVFCDSFTLVEQRSKHKYRS